MKAVTLDLSWARRIGVCVLLVGASPTAAANCACLQLGTVDLIIINWELPNRDGDAAMSCAGQAVPVVSNVHDSRDI